MSLHRIRIGNYVIGTRWNKSEHALYGNFMIGKVADTLGVLNTVKGKDDQLLFADFDTDNLPEIMEDLAEVSYEYNLGHILLFRSVTYEQLDNIHYFIISPCYYTPHEIKLILAEMESVDKKFVAVYMRDSVNAIRLVPKVINQISRRHISIVDILRNYPTEDFIPSRIYSRGMIDLISQFYNRDFSDYWKMTDYSRIQLDTTQKTDLTIREYETIRW